MRCVALAQAWQDNGGHAQFATVAASPGLRKRLGTEGIDILNIMAEPGSSADAAETASHARNFAAHWVVLDGYHFGADYQKVLKDAGCQLLVVDDHAHAAHYHADLVVNQNLHAVEDLYVNRDAHTHLLLGSRYALLRREFHRYRNLRREASPVAAKLLVTLGGSDPDNTTLRVIEALHQVRAQDLEVVIVAGAGNPHLQSLEASVAQSMGRFQLRTNVTDMAEFMAWADIAVAAAGSTSWELAFMGLPSVMLIIAENQRAIAERLAAAGACVNLGWHATVTGAAIAKAVGDLLGRADRRTALQNNLRSLVDGHGAERILAALDNLHSSTANGGAPAAPMLT